MGLSSGTCLPVCLKECFVSPPVVYVCLRQARRLPCSLFACGAGGPVPSSSLPGSTVSSATAVRAPPAPLSVGLPSPASRTPAGTSPELTIAPLCLPGGCLPLLAGVQLVAVQCGARLCVCGGGRCAFVLSVWGQLNMPIRCRRAPCLSRLGFHLPAALHCTALHCPKLPCPSCQRAACCLAA